MRLLTCILTLAGLTAGELSAAEKKPLRALLITGGCCHDYAKQKDLLKEGLEARINVVVDHVHSPDKSTKPPLAIFGNPDYAKGYDVVIQDECAGDVAIIRIEELYPWPEARILALMERYGNTEGVFWVQEEPANMGAWTFVRERLQGPLRTLSKLGYDEDA